MVKYPILILSLLSFGFSFCGEKSEKMKVFKDGTSVTLTEFANITAQLNRLSPEAQQALLEKCTNKDSVTFNSDDLEKKTCTIFLNSCDH